ncbi:G-box binding factor bZIP transcription factor [Trifolium medium]|uniref:G-box binding factor bZIP transcription factor n=1 Tax=Trifolium medium TaxID=97028 RepID=A0A392P202_9FABA|nr:G-box binding factor bZIP transcription factor [Trifolium medium]
MAAIIYGIWYARNQSVFEHRELQAKNVIEQASFSITKFQLANHGEQDISNNDANHTKGGNQHNTRRKHHRHAKSNSNNWSRPPNGIIKVNSDANLSKEGRWGLGAVCRDFEGHLLAAGTWNLPGFDDPATAEACALYLAVKLAIDCCFREVSFESDNSSLNAILNDPASLPRSYLGNLAWGILCNKTQSRACNFNHIGRGANKAAHALANMAHDEPNMVWIEEPIPQLVPILILDLIH